MKKIMTALLLSVSLYSLAACSTTKSDTSNSQSSNAASLTGTQLVVGANFSSLTSSSATTEVQSNDDNTTTVVFKSGDYKGQTLTLDANGEGTLDGKDVTAVLLDNDTAAVAGLLSIGSNSNDHSGTHIAQYAATEEAILPASGTATYSGTVAGVGMSGADAGSVSGTANLAADFGSSTVSGSFTGLSIDGTSSSVSNVTFSGTLDTDTATYSSTSVKLGGTTASAESRVDGVFGGDQASSTAGEFYVLDDDNSPTEGVFGVYQADKN